MRRDHFARALGALALSGVWTLMAYRDHGNQHTFDLVLAVFWAVWGAAELLIDIFKLDG